MSYNGQLANRIRIFLKTYTKYFGPDLPQLAFNSSLPKAPGDLLEERQLFGSLAFLVNGKMAFAVLRDDVIVRINPIQNHTLSPSVYKLVTSTGQPLHGWALVTKANHRLENELEKWIRLGIQNTFIA